MKRKQADFPCPECGRETSLKSQISLQAAIPSYYVVACEACGWTTPRCNTRQEAWKAYQTEVQAHD